MFGYVPTKYTEYQQQYIYTHLGKLSSGHTDPYNVYGVVFDASTPYFKNKCSCQIKLIDHTLNSKAAEVTAKGANTYISCQFFANDTKTLPHVIHIGDIVRIHRATISIYQDQKQLNCNLWKASSWTVFKGARSSLRNTAQLISLDGTQPNNEDLVVETKESLYLPIANSGERYSFHDSEIAILENLREWSRDYFGKYLVYDFATHIPQEI